MKKINIFYWIVTSLFAAFMLFSAIPDILVIPEAVDFVTGHLGYPVYFLPLIGVAKLLGAIAILVPGFPRLKEWAYAGFAFDLIGAVYSVVAIEGINGGTAFMIVPFTFLFVSYWLHHKRLRSKQQPGSAVPA